MSKLSTDQVKDLLTAHCYRVINNMSSDDLFSYAMQMMEMSFDKHPGEGDTDVEMLISDIWYAEGEDDDSTAEFIAGVGIDNEVADQLVAGHW